MEKWIFEIEEEVRACGQILLEADRSQAHVDEKSSHTDLVTAYDKMVQKRLQENLLKILPEAVFVGEEEDIHASIREGYAFIVDPIDGTTNFIKDYKASCISVGITKDAKSFAGLVYNPYLDEMFMAQKDCGAFLNGKPIHVTENPLSHGIVCIGTSPYYKKELGEKTLQMTADYYYRGQDLRRSGSAAIDACNVAAGRAELYVEQKISPWDCAAGIIITTEAGGVVTTLEGKKIDLSGPTSIMCGNAAVMKEELERLEK